MFITEIHSSMLFKKALQQSSTLLHCLEKLFKAKRINNSVIAIYKNICNKKENKNAKYLIYLSGKCLLKVPFFNL